MIISILYGLTIENMLGGHFSLGRAAELAQMDLIAIILYRILRYHRLRWRRIKDMDEKEKEKEKKENT